MANTTNFNWETPDDTDLVKDGAAAIRTLGSAIDTSLVDLKGGTTGQILSKATGTDMDFTWITNDVGDITAVSAGTGISGGGTSGAITITNDMATTITASGDIVVGTGSGTYDNLPIGTTGQVLTADTTVSPYKVKWATAASGSGLTLIQRSTFSNVANTGTTFDNVFSSTYKAYKVIIEQLYAATAANDPILEMLYSGSVLSSLYFGAAGGAQTGSSTFVNVLNNNTTEFTFGTNIGDSTSSLSADLLFTKVGNASERFLITGTSAESASDIVRFLGCTANSSQTYTGFRLRSSSSNITGVVAVYGLAAS